MGLARRNGRIGFTSDRSAPQTSTVMTTVYVVSNDEQVVKQAILDTVGVAVESLGDAMHLRDQMPESKIFAVEIRENPEP